MFAFECGSLPYAVGLVSLISSGFLADDILHGGPHHPMQPLLSRRTLRHAAGLASGTALAQALPLLVTPVLSRLYSPTDFGRFGVFSAVLLGLSLVVSGRYEIGIPLPKEDRDASALMLTSLVISFISTLLLLIVGISFSLFAPDAMGFAAGTMVLGSLFAGVLSAAAMQSLSYWFTRTARFGLVARARVIQGVVAAVGSLALGWADLVSFGLIVALAASFVLAALYLTVAFVRSDLASLHGLSFEHLNSVAREYREFPLVNMTHAALDAAKDSVSLLIFSALFGVAAVGQLTQALRILRAPTTLVGQAVAQVYFPKASSRVAEHASIQSMTRRTLAVVLAISVPIYLVFLLFGPWLFPLVLGPEWTLAGEFARLLSPWLALALAVSSLSLLPVVRRRQPTALAINVLDLTARLIGILAGAQIGGATGAVAGIAAGGLVIGVFQLGWYVRLSSDVVGTTEGARSLP